MKTEKVYDYNFSKEVVNDFQRAFEEAFEEVCGLYSVDYKDIIFLFRTDQERWHQFKRVVKFVEENKHILKDEFYRGPHSDDYKKRYGVYESFLHTMIKKSYRGKNSVFDRSTLDKENRIDYNIIGHDKKEERPEYDPRQLLLPFKEATVWQ